MDAGYGDLGVLRGLERMEVAFCVGVRKNFTVRIPEEIDALAASSEAAPTHRVLDIAAALPEAAWTTVIYRHETDGPLTKRFAAVHVVAATKEETGSMVWLLIERPLGDRQEYKYHAVFPRRQNITHRATHWPDARSEHWPAWLPAHPAVHSHSYPTGSRRRCPALLHAHSSAARSRPTLPPARCG